MDWLDPVDHGLLTFLLVDDRFPVASKADDFTPERRESAKHAQAMKVARALPENHPRKLGWDWVCGERRAWDNQPGLRGAWLYRHVDSPVLHTYSDGDSCAA